MPPNENYCFFGSLPVLRHKLMTAIPQYPPESWNAYGEYLWWWVPTETLQKSAINVFGVPMTRTSSAPYTFAATGTQAGLYFSKLIFDNDGYMTDFAAKDAAIGLDIGLGSAAPQPLHLVEGLAYYQNTMGRAVPPVTTYRLSLTVVSDMVGKGGGSVHGDGDISCTGQGSNVLGMSGTCQADFTAGTTVNLYQTPDADSRWATWPISDCGTNQNCQISMSGNQNLTVTFPYSPMARIDSTGQGFESLPLAYGSAAQVDTIYGRAVTFTENFTLGGSKAVTLLGGRDAWYLPQNAWTILQGVLAIQGGSLTVDRLVIE